MKTDMSPEAIRRRLQQVSDLRDLCLYLTRAGETMRPRGNKHEPASSLANSTKELALKQEPLDVNQG